MDDPIVSERKWEKSGTLTQNVFSFFFFNKKVPIGNCVRPESNKFE